MPETPANKIVAAKIEIHIPHNHIHKILKQYCIAKDEPKKQKRRKWIRYEREHSNSLWHIDYSEFDGKNVLGLLDDASRLIVGYGEFDNATEENAASVLEKAVNKYGTPKQLLSDNGSHFASVIKESCAEPEHNIFQKKLSELGIEHIKARIHHPQTNGKLERWFLTLKQLKKHFGSTQKAINYNNKRPHMSLNNGSLRTPAQAYQEKFKE
ncbi:MAG: DDE-type integrase/transposase/recombinase [Candidatus Diapherotrites archaeon]